MFALSLCLASCTVTGLSIGRALFSKFYHISIRKTKKPGNIGIHIIERRVRVTIASVDKQCILHILSVRVWCVWCVCVVCEFVVCLCVCVCGVYVCGVCLCVVCVFVWCLWCVYVCV